MAGNIPLSYYARTVFNGARGSLKGIFRATHGLHKLVSPSFHVRKEEAIGAVYEVSASHKLFKRYTALVTILFTLSAVAPWYTSAEGIDADSSAYFFEPEYIDTTIITDNEGYIAKANPQTNSGDRATMNDYIIHTIAPGETISQIAKDHGLKTETIMWENDIANASSIRAGQDLIIPPVDGITHVVAKGETIEKIAQLYGIDPKKIKEQNSLIAEIRENDEIIVPGGRPLPKPEPVMVAQVSNVTQPDAKKKKEETPQANTQKKSNAKVKAKTPANSNFVAASPENAGKGFKFIKPTRGSVTCGYGCYGGHYALDIADRGKQPPVWASADGVIVKASSGTYAGGYGTHVIIDHGNGYKTLYAHMVAGSLTVKVGDKVKQGQKIGIMGNTGRVFGSGKGIHTHFEIMKNGVKESPAKYIAV